MKLITDIARYHEIVVAYRRQGVLTNDYLQTESVRLVEKGLLYEDCGVNNAALYVKMPVGYRLYYYINDVDERLGIVDVDCETEILYRTAVGVSEQEVTFLTNNGYVRDLVRDQYSGAYQKMAQPKSVHEGISIDVASNLDEVRKSAELFNGIFNNMSGDYIADSCYESLLSNHEILVARSSTGDFLGALHMSIQGKIAWAHHVAVTEAARGKGIGRSLFDTYMARMHAQGIDRYMLWCQQQNQAAVSLYLKLGFTTNGKSSLSMIRLNHIDK